MVERGDRIPSLDDYTICPPDCTMATCDTETCKLKCGCPECQCSTFQKIRIVTDTDNEMNTYEYDDYAECLCCGAEIPLSELPTLHKI